MLRVILSNPNDPKDEIDYTIKHFDHKLGQDWRQAIENILQGQYLLNKNFCFLGFPNPPRSLEYLCDQLNQAVYAINTYDWEQHGLTPYRIEEWFSPDVIRFGPEYPPPPAMHKNMFFSTLKHEVMNRLHNHFERLQGTVENISPYFQAAPAHLRKAMGRLNTCCHEIESLVIAQRQSVMSPEWLRPSQIMSYDRAPRIELLPEHRELFKQNGYDRKFGNVYMHWAQIGKTLFEVFRDEHAPVLTDTICEAIKPLRYYSGEFDIEWGRDIVLGGSHWWHNKQIAEFKDWLVDNNIDPDDTNHSLGYLPIGEIDIAGAFGTTDCFAVWDILGKHLNVKRIEGYQYAHDYNYTWAEQDV